MAEVFDVPHERSARRGNRVVPRTRYRARPSSRRRDGLFCWVQAEQLMSDERRHTLVALDIVSENTATAGRAVATRTLNGGALACEALLAAGVTTLFGYPGGAALPFYRELARYPALRHVLVRHEQNAAHAADGFARSTGRVGVCVATSGPGATNLLTGLATAFMDCVPLVALTGQVARAALGTQAFQEVDIVGMVGPITKGAFQLQSASDIPGVFAEAFRLASEGRPGPVLIDFPRDVQLASVVVEGTLPDLPPPIAPELSPAAELALQQAAALLARSERPVL